MNCVQLPAPYGRCRILPTLPLTTSPTATIAATELANKIISASKSLFHCSYFLSNQHYKRLSLHNAHTLKRIGRVLFTRLRLFMNYHLIQAHNRQSYNFTNFVFNFSTKITSLVRFLGNTTATCCGFALEKIGAYQTTLTSARRQKMEHK